MVSLPEETVAESEIEEYNYAKKQKADNQSCSDIFEDVNYICSSTNIITTALQDGNDIAQLPSGDIVITEVKVVNTQYSWDPKKNKMVKIAQY